MLACIARGQAPPGIKAKDVERAVGRYITVTLPKPITSGIEAKGRFGKQDFVYLSDEDVYRCPAGEKLAYHFTNEENGLVLRRYWTNACQSCSIKQRCTTGKERRTRMDRCWRTCLKPEQSSKRLQESIASLLVEPSTSHQGRRENPAMPSQRICRRSQSRAANSSLTRGIMLMMNDGSIA
jgi:hypothetical protein